jgi:hypothetical protein
MNDRMPDDKPTRVPARASQWWNSPSAIDLASTEGLTAIRGDRAKSALSLQENPLTGKPDAGNPPVRFGGRGSGHPLSLPLSLFRSEFCRKPI